VRGDGHPLEREAGVDALDRALDRGGGALDAALDGVPEEGDVALPPRGPVGRLRGQALLGPRHHHVKRCEGGHAGGAEEGYLRGAGCGDADGHFGGLLMWEGLFVLLLVWSVMLTDNDSRLVVKMAAILLAV